MKKQIKKIVVVGRDADAWLTALMMQLSFAKSNASVTVHLIELPSRLRPADFYTVLPTHKAFHKVLGVDESLLLQASFGMHSFGQRFSGWAGVAEPFLHAYDTHGVDFANIDFFQYWLKARKQGMNVLLEDFSLGVVAAKQSRSLVFDSELEAFSKATSGYNLDALPYLKTIGRAALEAGLEHSIGEIKRVNASNEYIQSIELLSGVAVSGDLFIDTSGIDAVLIRELETENNYVSWREWFPCDRSITASTAPLSPMPAFSQISAFAHGWLGFFPLRNRTAVKAFYSSGNVNSSEMLETMTALSGMKMKAAFESEVAVGARKKQWIGNCIALGSSAINFDSLDATDLHATHLGLSLMREFFPVCMDNMKEAEIFNEKMHTYSINVRDFQAGHYKLNKRFGDSLWDGARDANVPDTLAKKMKLFEARGLVAMYEHETFQEENWISLFVGHGIIPKNYNPLVDNMPEDEQRTRFRGILKYIASEVDSMPVLK